MPMASKIVMQLAANVRVLSVLHAIMRNTKSVKSKVLKAIKSTDGSISP